MSQQQWQLQYQRQPEQRYLRVVQQSVDGVDVGFRSHHHSVGGNSGQVAVLVLRHLAPGAVSAQQLEV